MGFFDKPEVDCCVCGRKIGSKEKRWQIKGGYICPDCQAPFCNLSGSKAFVGYDAEQMVEMIEKHKKLNTLLAINKETYQSLKPTRIIENSLFIDDDAEKWYYDSGKRAAFYLKPDAAFPIVYGFSDILEISIARGGKTIRSTSTTRKEKGIRKAIAGGLIAGETGVLLGGMLSRSSTATNTVESQTYYVNAVLYGENEVLSMPFLTEQSAEQVRLALVGMIKDPLEEKNSQDTSISSADEIRKFKQLLDDGIITQEEFNVKKKQLLGL